MKIRYILNRAVSAFLIVLFVCSACNDTKSYSEMLRDEEHAVNWYLASQRVVPYVPEDSVFEVGSEAPFYKMDSDGNVYMRVVNPGDKNNRPKKGDTVYFRFTRTNIIDLSNGGLLGGGGSLEDDMQFPSWSLVYGNTSLTSTTEKGTGLQVPLKYLGYNCQVDLIVKSVEGAAGDISNCVPYLYTGLKYFKAEY